MTISSLICYIVLHYFLDLVQKLNNNEEITKLRPLPLTGYKYKRNFLQINHSEEFSFKKIRRTKSSEQNKKTTLANKSVIRILCSPANQNLPIPKINKNGLTFH